MQERHLFICIRYIEMDPVRANLVTSPDKWPRSSAASHISGQSDGFVNCRPLLDIVKGDWKASLMKVIDNEAINTFRKYERTGRPAGDNDFIEKVEKITGRQVKLGKPGPKPKSLN